MFWRQTDRDSKSAVLFVARQSNRRSELAKSLQLLILGVLWDLTRRGQALCGPESTTVQTRIQVVQSQLMKLCLHVWKFPVDEFNACDALWRAILSPPAVG